MVEVEIRQMLSNWLVNHIDRVDKRLKINRPSEFAISQRGD